MKRLIAVVAVAAGCAALAVPAFAATKTVRVGPQVSFGPTSVRLESGDKIRFRWTGGLPHDVTVGSGPSRFTIKRRTSGTVTKTFRRTGTYRLLCTIHAPGMRMTVRVRD